MFSYTHYKSLTNVEDGIDVELSTLEQLAQRYPCKKVRRDPRMYDAETKQKGSFMVRGICDGRKLDTGISESKLIFIDVDKPADKKKPIATPSACSEFLAGLNINHWIYTSYSHLCSTNVIKYRIIIELDLYIERVNLKSNVQAIMKVLAPMNIDYVCEMDTWSQAWFLPRTPNIGAFESHGHFSGVPFQATYDDPDEVEQGYEQKQSSGKSETLSEMHRNIRTGSEFHQSLLNLTWQKAKMGVDRAFIIAEYTEMLEASIERNGNDPHIVSRAERSIRELEAMVDEAIRKVAEETPEGGDLDDLVDDSKKASYTPPPFPPGHIGEYLESIHSTMSEQSREIAFVMGMSALSTACGAGFNGYASRYSGLNLAFILVGETGFGKSQIRRFLNGFFLNGLHTEGHSQIKMPLMNCQGYLGPNGNTGQTAMHKGLMENRSQVLILSEAGHTMGNDDNSAKLIGYSMETLVSSACDEYSMKVSFSNADNNLERFRAPNLNLVLESTERALAAKFSDMGALESGWVTRHTTIKLDKKPPRNKGRTRTVMITPYAGEQVGKMLAFSKVAQTCNDTELDNNVNFCNFSDDQLFRLQDWEDSLDNRYERGSAAAMISTRLAHKVIKYASIATIFNKWTENDVKLGNEELEWGIQFAEWELSQLDHNLTVAVQGDQYSQLDGYIEGRILALINKPVAGMTERQRKCNIVTVAILKDACRSSLLLEMSIKVRKDPRMLLVSRLHILRQDNKINVHEKHLLSGTRSLCIEARKQKRTTL